MTNTPDPLAADDHDEQSMEEAEEKMLLRHDEHDAHDEDSDDEPVGGEHDPEALAEADRKMLLRDDKT